MTVLDRLLFRHRANRAPVSSSAILFARVISAIASRWPSTPGRPTPSFTWRRSWATRRGSSPRGGPIDQCRGHPQPGGRCGARTAGGVRLDGQLLRCGPRCGLHRGYAARAVKLVRRDEGEAETLLLDQCETVVCRLATAFGVSSRLRLDLLVNDFVYRALREHRLTVYEGGASAEFPSRVRCRSGDAAGADKAGQLVGQALNVGDESLNCTKLDVCRVIQQVIAGVVVEKATAGRDPDRRDYAVSYARVKALGFHATVSLEAGIRELAKVLPWIDRPELFGNVQHPQGFLSSETSRCDTH